MIFFSVLVKFGVVFALMPTPIIAALYCLFFAYVGGVGLSFLQFCNLNNFRTNSILGFFVFLGLSVPQYFNEYDCTNMSKAMAQSTRLQDGSICSRNHCLFLDNTLYYKDGEL